MYIQNVTITEIDLHDEHEGVLKLLCNDCEISAFFYGDSFVVGEKFDAEFFNLDYPPPWEVIFSENSQKIKALVSAPGLCSYYCYGIILSINPIIADFGSMQLNIGEWSHDDRIIGEYIYWYINRLDVSRH